MGLGIVQDNGDKEVSIMRSESKIEMGDEWPCQQVIAKKRSGRESDVADEMRNR